jgi:hypothetical protein
MGGISRLFGLVVVGFVAYVAIKNNMIDVHNLKAQFVDPYVSPYTIQTVEDFVTISLQAAKDFGTAMKV